MIFVTNSDESDNFLISGCVKHLIFTVSLNPQDNPRDKESMILPSWRRTERG